jgi:hypothetical protein
MRLLPNTLAWFEAFNTIIDCHLSISGSFYSL